MRASVLLRELTLLALQRRAAIRVRHEVSASRRRRGAWPRPLPRSLRPTRGLFAGGRSASRQCEYSTVRVRLAGAARRRPESAFWARDVSETCKGWPDGSGRPPLIRVPTSADRVAEPSQPAF